MRRGLAVMGVGVLVVAALVLSGCGGKQVPNVVGMRQADAVRTLQDAGYMLGEVSMVATKSVELGRIAAQSPAAGERAKDGTAVGLAISFADGSDVIVPNVVGVTQTTAEGIANTLGLTAVATEGYSADVPKGTVYQQVPTQGSQVPAGETLVMVISKGPEPEKADVPDVTGKSESDAVDKVESAGFKSEVTKIYSSDVEKGKVIVQSPEGGTSAKTGSTVQIVVSLGKGTGAVKVPSVKGKKESDAVSSIEKAGLKAKKIYSYSTSVSKGVVIEQFPASGSTAAKGSEVLIQISKGAEPSSTVTVPNVSGMSAADAQSALAAEGFETTVQQKGTAAESDTVVYQFPPAGEKAAPGADVLIVVGAP